MYSKLKLTLKQKVIVGLALYVFRHHLICLNVRFNFFFLHFIVIFYFINNEIIYKHINIYNLF